MHFTAKMAPNHHFMLNGLPLEPVSRTYQYRKIMKPMLERKRRARINKCLDELKDLMTGTLQADGENVSKLEKADILELTVRHLHRLREHNVLFLRSNDTLNMEKFWAGFQHCAAEVSQFLSKYDQRTNHVSGDLIKYIANYVPNMAAAMAAAAAATTNASIQTTIATTTASATNTPAVTPMNDHYQRFYTTLGHVPPPGMTATAVTEDQRMQNSPTIDLRVLQVAKQPKVRMHPYARRMAEMGNDFSDGDGGGGDEVEADDVDKCDGSVWRPW